MFRPHQIKKKLNGTSLSLSKSIDVLFFIRLGLLIVYAHSLKQYIIKVLKKAAASAAASAAAVDEMELLTHTLFYIVVKNAL